MKVAIVAAVLAASAVPAFADDDTATCQHGAELLAAGDLPRAAIALEGCSTPAADELARKLRASQLSAMSISTTSRMTIETSALPGEKLQSPVTVWAPAGTYTVKATTSDNIVLTTTVKLPPHARMPVLLTAPPPVRLPRPGKADFTNEAALEPAHEGPLPAQQHKSLLPCKYEGCNTHGGEELADPLAAADEYIPPFPPAKRIGVRAGVGAGDRIGPSAALSLHATAPWEDADEPTPFAFELRPFEWNRRGGSDRFAASIGIERVIADPDAAWISFGLSARGEVRDGDRMTIPRRFDIGGAASLELALRKLPVTIGARFEQDLSEHLIVVEVGGDFRSR